MKKFVAILTAVVLAALLVVPAFATSPVTFDSRENTATFPGEQDIDVTVNVKDEAGQDITATVYYVTVAWESLDFTFKFEVENQFLTWNPEQHQYWNTQDDEAAEGEWVDNDDPGRSIVVTNHSNASIRYAASFTNDLKSSEELNGVIANIYGDDDTLPTAEGTTYAAAPNAGYAVKVSGTPTTKSTFKVDTITIAISAN